MTDTQKPSNVQFMQEKQYTMVERKKLGGLIKWYEKASTKSSKNVLVIDVGDEVDQVELTFLDGEHRVVKLGEN